MAIGMKRVDVLCFGGGGWWYHKSDHIDIQLMEQLDEELGGLLVA